jgi:hypothetical protein
MTRHRKRGPGIVVGGRYYDQEEAYRLELGEEALTRSIALPDPVKLLGWRAKVDQPRLFDEDACRGRRPSMEELYEHEQSRR